jgi:hypothetical protein
MCPRKLLALLVASLLAGSLNAHSEGEHGSDKGTADHGESKGHNEDGEHHEEQGHDHGDRAQHFEGKPAKTLDQALSNLRKANKQMETLLAKDELSSDDMNQIHKLSYTMENAMARLDEELEGMANDLEWVHKASERLDEKTIRAKGGAYLKATGELTK